MGIRTITTRGSKQGFDYNKYKRSITTGLSSRNSRIHDIGRSLLDQPSLPPTPRTATLEKHVEKISPKPQENSSSIPKITEVVRRCITPPTTSSIDTQTLKLPPSIPESVEEISPEPQEAQKPLLEQYNSLPQTVFMKWCNGIKNDLSLNATNTKISNRSKRTMVHFNPETYQIGGFANPLTPDHFEQLAFFQIMDILGFSSNAPSVCCLPYDNTGYFYKECIRDPATNCYASPLSKIASEIDIEVQFQQNNIITIAILAILFQNLDFSSLVIDIDTKEEVSTAFLKIDNPHSFPLTRKEESFFERPLAQLIKKHCPSIFDQPLDSSTLEALKTLINIDLNELLSPYFFSEDSPQLNFIKNRISLLKTILTSKHNAITLTIKNLAFSINLEPDKIKKTVSSVKTFKKQIHKNDPTKPNSRKFFRRKKSEESHLESYSSDTFSQKLSYIISDHLDCFAIEKIERTSPGVITHLQKYLLNKVPLPYLIDKGLLDAHIVMGLYKKTLRENEKMIESLNAFRNHPSYQIAKEASKQINVAYEKHDMQIIESLYAENNPFFQITQTLFQPESKTLHNMTQYVYQNLKTIEKLINQTSSLYESKNVVNLTSNSIVSSIFEPMIKQNENPDVSSEQKAPRHIIAYNRQIIEHNRNVSKMYAPALFPLAGECYDTNFIRTDITVINELFYYLLTHREEVFPPLV